MPSLPKSSSTYRLNALFAAAVSDEDFEDVVFKLVDMAKDGNIHAIKEVLDRTIGKPTTQIAMDVTQRETPLQVVARLHELLGLSGEEEAVEPIEPIDVEYKELTDEV